MTVVAAPQPTKTTNDPETRLVLEPVSWGLYQQILRELGDNRGKRLTYDNGRLEIMSPSDLHERVKTIAARLVETYAAAMGIAVEGYGSMTMDREELQQGIEPDECYYVQSFHRLPEAQRLDMATDPPPDLAIEVDISPPGVAKQPIYAALGVGEIWRYDGARFRVLRRTEDGGYVEKQESGCFPDLPLEQFNRFVQIGLKSRQPAALQALLAWLTESKRQG